MSKLPIPSIPDIASIVLSSEPDTVRALLEYYERQSGLFNYNPFHKVCGFYFKGGLREDVAVQSCYRMGAPAGYKQNAETTAMLCQWAKGRNFSFYEQKREFLPIRHDFKMPVPINGVIVENRSPSFLWMQPRKGFSPSLTQMSFIASCIKQVYGTDDHENLGLTILDFSAPANGAKRVQRVYTYDDLALFQEYEIGQLLNDFADAYRTLLEAGYQRPSRTLKKRDEDPPQGTLL